MPATIAIVHGVPHVGLTTGQIQMLGKEGHEVCIPVGEEKKRTERYNVLCV